MKGVPCVRLEIGFFLRDDDRDAKALDGGKGWSGKRFGEFEEGENAADVECDCFIEER